MTTDQKPLPSTIVQILTAFQFLTRIPVSGFHGGDIGRAARWFPLVGVVLGAALGGLFWLGDLLGLPPLANAAAVVAALALITGALHEDGLGDLADGLGGGATRDRALDIMRDSRIGTFGAVAIGSSLLLRVAALAEIPAERAIPALVLALAGGRFFMVLALISLPFARPDGLAVLARAARGPVTALIAGLTLLASAVGCGAAALPALGAAGLGFAWICWRLVRRLGGQTGDGLGAIEQITSALILLALAAAWT